MTIPPVIRNGVNRIAKTIKRKALNVAGSVLPDCFVRQNSAEIKETLKREASAGAGNLLVKLQNLGKKARNSVGSVLPDARTVEVYKREVVVAFGKLLKRLKIVG